MEKASTFTFLYPRYVNGEQVCFLLHACGMLPTIDLYLPYLEDLVLSSAEKEELINIVWRLMEQQVNQAFNTDTVVDNNGVISSLSDVP